MLTHVKLVDSAFNITILLDRGWRDSLTHDRNVSTLSIVPSKPQRQSFMPAKVLSLDG